MRVNKVIRTMLLLPLMCHPRQERDVALLREHSNILSGHRWQIFWLFPPYFLCIDSPKPSAPPEKDPWGVLYEVLVSVPVLVLAMPVLAMPLLLLLSTLPLLSLSPLLRPQRVSVTPFATFDTIVWRMSSLPSWYALYLSFIFLCIRLYSAL